MFSILDGICCMKKINKKSFESDVKSKLRALCQEHSALLDHNAASIFMKAGREDYNILTKNGITIYCEVKSPTGKLSEAQIRRQKEVELRGGIYFVYNGLNDDELIKYLTCNY